MARNGGRVMHIHFLTGMILQKRCCRFTSHKRLLEIYNILFGSIWEALKVMYALLKNQVCQNIIKHFLNNNEQTYVGDCTYMSWQKQTSKSGKQHDLINMDMICSCVKETKITLHRIHTSNMVPILVEWPCSSNGMRFTSFYWLFLGENHSKTTISTWKR